MSGKLVSVGKRLGSGRVGFASRARIVASGTNAIGSKGKGMDISKTDRIAVVASVKASCGSRCPSCEANRSTSRLADHIG